MKHPSHDPNCSVCQAGAGERAIPGGILFENDLWLVRAAPPPYGVPGWMTVQTQSHVAGIAHFSDAEAASIGPTLRHMELLLEKLTGALRIYTVTMNESTPHFHLHMVPRYAQMPNDLKGFPVFDLQRLTIAGEVKVDAAESERLIAAYKSLLASNPPPR